MGLLGSIPGLGRCPGEGNGNPLQYPFLENLMDRGAWSPAVHGVEKRVLHNLVTEQQQYDGNKNSHVLCLVAQLCLTLR